MNEYNINHTAQCRHKAHIVETKYLSQECMANLFMGRMDNYILFKTVILVLPYIHTLVACWYSLIQYYISVIYLTFNLLLYKMEQTLFIRVNI